MNNQKVILRSYLENQPVIKQEENYVRSFGVMKTFESFRSPEGEMGRTKPETHYIGALGEYEATMLSNFKKGAYIEVEGVLERRQFRGKDGIDHDSYMVRPDKVTEVSPNLPRLNSFTVEGKLTGDPNVTNKNPGKGHASFGLAVDVRDCDLRDPTLFQPVETFNRNRVDEIASLKEGDAVKLEGRLVSSIFTAPSGRIQERYSLSPRSIELISKAQTIDEKREPNSQNEKTYPGNQVSAVRAKQPEAVDQQAPDVAF